MYANLFEHETCPNREQLNRIMDAISPDKTLAEIDAEFIRKAVAAGFTIENAEQFLIGDPSL